MQKDELIQLHSFLVQIRLHLEEKYKNNNHDSFLEYDNLDISPHQIYKSKDDHKNAVFELSKGISKMCGILKD